MTMTGLDNIDRTVHKTNEWLAEIEVDLELNDRHEAYRSLRATLHALRDRLTVEEAVHLGAQLPMLVRGMYYEGWRPTGKPLPIRNDEEFLDLVRAELVGMEHLRTKRIVRTVLRSLEDRVSAGEIDDVKQALPERIRELWPA